MAETTISLCTSIVNENSPIRIDFLNENTPIVSSLDIAHHFQKKHKNVLRDIQDLRSILPKSFVELNFGPKLHTVDAGNGATRRIPSYSLSRDAFSLLVMGFTGAAALKWKLKYIEAFNALEAALRENIRTDALAEARSLPALEADRKAAYLDGMQEGQKLQKRRDGLKRLVKIRRCVAAGLTQGEVGAALGMTSNAIQKMLARARKAGLLA